MWNDRIARIVGLIQINHLFILTIRSYPAVLDLAELNIHRH